eukprot:SAG11_NODE_1920_length_4069_cov_3.001511_4_plen_111_part_00
MLQTCQDLIARGYNVHIVADGVSSQRELDRSVGLARATAAGKVPLLPNESTGLCANLMPYRREVSEHTKPVSETANFWLFFYQWPCHLREWLRLMTLHNFCRSTADVGRE